MHFTCFDDTFAWISRTSTGVTPVVGELLIAKKRIKNGHPRNSQTTSKDI